MDNKNVLMLISDVQKIFHNHMREESEKNNLNNTYRPVIFFLSRFDGMTQLDLVKRTRLKAPTISLTLRKMEQEGLVKRVIDENDARKVCVYLTEKGYAYDDKIKELIKTTEKQVLSKLEEKENKELERVLRKLINIMCQEFGEFNENI